MIEIVALIGEIVKQIRELFCLFAPEQDATFDEIEPQVRSVMLEIGRQIVESIFSHKQEPPEPEIQSVKRVYTGTDGVMVPTVDGYKEMKVITMYDTSLAKR